MMEQGMLTPKGDRTGFRRASRRGGTQRGSPPRRLSLWTWSRTSCFSQFSEHDLLSDNYRIYTTLDMDVQQAASAAGRYGRRGDRQALEANSKLPKDAPKPDPLQPQMALVVLDTAHRWLKPWWADAIMAAAN